jgi:hypothetical protein
MRSSLLRKPNLTEQPNSSELHQTSPGVYGCICSDYCASLFKREKRNMCQVTLRGCHPHCPYGYEISQRTRGILNSQIIM